MRLSTEAAIVAAGLGVVALVLWRGSHAVTGAARGAARALDPTNPDNAANSAVSAAGRALTGRADFSLGSWVYDVLHPDDGRTATAPTPPPARAGAEASVNPWAGQPVDFGYGDGWTAPPPVDFGYGRGW